MILPDRGYYQGRRYLQGGGATREGMPPGRGYHQEGDTIREGIPPGFH